MKKVIFMVWVLLCFCVPQAQAYLVNATLTADNHYGLYYGNATGSSLALVGRNEFGTAGAPGTYNWSLPETYSFNTMNNNYLYVLAWDDHVATQSFIGQFSVSGVGTIFTNTTSWQAMVATGNNPGNSGNLPGLGVVQNDILTGQWTQPLASAPQGTYPWGTIPGISSQANFIWHDTFSQNTSSYGHYAIFRTQLPVTATPEPATFLLLAAGLLGMMVLRNRKFSLTV